MLQNECERHAKVESFCDEGVGRNAHHEVLCVQKHFSSITFWPARCTGFSISSVIVKLNQKVEQVS